MFTSDLSYITADEIITSLQVYVQFKCHNKTKISKTLKDKTTLIYLHNYNVFTLYIWTHASKYRSQALTAIYPLFYNNNYNFTCHTSHHS